MRNTEVSNILIPLFGWIAFGFAFFANTASLEQFMLLAISRVLP